MYELYPPNYLSGLKARLLLGVTLRSDKEAQMVSKAFAPYQ
jgi:hypothetical protein